MARTERLGCRVVRRCAEGVWRTTSMQSRVPEISAGLVSRSGKPRTRGKLPQSRTRRPFRHLPGTDARQVFHFRRVVRSFHLIACGPTSLPAEHLRAQSPMVSTYLSRTSQVPNSTLPISLYHPFVPTRDSYSRCFRSDSEVGESLAVPGSTDSRWQSQPTSPTPCSMQALKPSPQVPM